MSRGDESTRTMPNSTGCTMSLPVGKRAMKLRETIVSLEESKKQIDDRIYLLKHELDVLEGK